MIRRLPVVVLVAFFALLAHARCAPADAPVRVGIAAESARLMARMPTVAPGQRRVLDVASEARALIESARDAAMERGDHNLFFQALTGYDYGYEKPETAEVRAARIRNVRALDDAGFAAMVDEMAKGSPASDVAFLPFDVPREMSFHTLVSDALEARMRTALATRPYHALSQLWR